MYCGHGFIIFSGIPFFVDFGGIDEPQVSMFNEL